MERAMSRYTRCLCIVMTLVFLFGSGAGILAAEWNEDPVQKAKRMEWWTDARFGMFIHWGLYAMPARHEWVRNREKISNEDYQKYFDLWNPDLYNPKEWAKAAKAAGMKYFVVTAKHHEGFCLWDSDYTDYKVTNTPYGKSLLKPMVEAFREEGIKVGFYYSLIDWHHPEFTVDQVHPMRDHVVDLCFPHVVQALQRQQDVRVVVVGGGWETYVRHDILPRPVRRAHLAH